MSQIISMFPVINMSSVLLSEWESVWIPASWCSPEHRVGCSKQGWGPARSLPPVHQAGETPPSAAGRRLLPALCPARRLRQPGRRLPAARRSWFPAPQHRRKRRGPSALLLPPLHSSSGDRCQASGTVNESVSGPCSYKIKVIALGMKNGLCDYSHIKKTVTC